MKKCWVNIYRALYPGGARTPKYYLSLGYDTKKAATIARYQPKAIGIQDRYIGTVKIVLPK